MTWLDSKHTKYIIAIATSSLLSAKYRLVKDN